MPPGVYAQSSFRFHPLALASLETKLPALIRPQETMRSRNSNGLTKKLTQMKPKPAAQTLWCGICRQPRACITVRWYTIPPTR